MALLRWLLAFAVVGTSGIALAQSQGSGAGAGAGLAAAGDRISTGFHLIATYFPSSSESVPGQPGVGQMSALFGPQLEIGYLMARGFRFMGLVHAGYVAAGEAPGSGDDGLILGFGADVAYTALPAALSGLEPYVRLVFDRRLASFSDNEFGTLSSGATYVAVGSRLLQGVLEVEVGVGGDYAGGSAFMLGLGIGYLN